LTISVNGDKSILVKHLMYKI